MLQESLFLHLFDSYRNIHFDIQDWPWLEHKHSHQQLSRLENAKINSPINTQHADKRSHINLRQCCHSWRVSQYSMREQNTEHNMQYIFRRRPTFWIMQLSCDENTFYTLWITSVCGDSSKWCSRTCCLPRVGVFRRGTECKHVFFCFVLSYMGSCHALFPGRVI